MEEKFFNVLLEIQKDVKEIKSKQEDMEKRQITMEKKQQDMEKRQIMMEKKQEDMGKRQITMEKKQNIMETKQNVMETKQDAIVKELKDIRGIVGEIRNNELPDIRRQRILDSNNILQILDYQGEIKIKMEEFILQNSTF